MIPTEAEFLGVLRKVIAALDAVGIEYALGGSFASSLYGEARATRDVDLVAAVAGRQAAPIVAALGPEFYADEAEIAAATIHQLALHLDMQEEVLLGPIVRGDPVEPVDLPFAGLGVAQELAQFLVQGNVSAGPIDAGMHPGETESQERFEIPVQRLLGKEIPPPFKNGGTSRQRRPGVAITAPRTRTSMESGAARRSPRPVGHRTRPRPHASVLECGAEHRFRCRARSGCVRDLGGARSSSTPVRCRGELVRSRTDPGTAPVFSEKPTGRGAEYSCAARLKVRAPTSELRRLETRRQ
jgi:hypothetical protein